MDGAAHPPTDPLAGPAWRHERFGPPWQHPRWRGRPWRDPRRITFRIVVMVTVLQCLGTLPSVRSGRWDPTAVHMGPWPVPWYLLLALAALPLALRRRMPRLTMAATLLPTVVYFGAGYPPGPGFLAALFGGYSVVRAGHRAFAWGAAVAGFAGYATLALASGAGPGRVATVGVWVAVAVGFLETARVRAAHVAEMARAGAERQRAYAEHRRALQERERRQASEERLRIAQELHDVIGHHLSLINVQAGVGLHLMDERPEQAREALAAVKHASAEALREIRGLLATLQDDGSVPLAPTTGIADLDRLVEHLTAAGLAVTVHRDGVELGGIPAGVDRAAYRIVQEALTNVRRHAGPAATATVTLARHGDDLIVVVTDDGPASGSDDAGQPGGPDSGGSGIVGMRERAAALGGEATAGPLPGGGFEVRARLPLAERREHA